MLKLLLRYLNVEYDVGLFIVTQGTAVVASECDLMRSEYIGAG